MAFWTYYFLSCALNEKTDTVYAIKDTGGMIIDNNEITLLGDVQKFSRQ